MEKLIEMSLTNGLTLKLTKIVKIDDKFTTVKANFMFTTEWSMLEYFCDVLNAKEEIVSAECGKKRKNK